MIADNRSMSERNFRVIDCTIAARLSLPAAIGSEHFSSHSRGNTLSGNTAVSYQIDDSARTVFDRRGAEFCFYCRSHTYIV